MAWLRVMSFNIRYAAAKDGENRWDQRKEMVVETIRAYDPDLLGLQEVQPVQRDFFRERLTEYHYLGSGREENGMGEACPVLFRKSRFELLNSGQFWLSETPEKEGSKGWDAALPRVVTWAMLKDRPSGREFLYVNTHWDHIGNVACVESAKLMSQRIPQLAQSKPVVITGDFNTREDEEAYRLITESFRDAYREMHPHRDVQEQTYHAFKGTPTGMRIDWILHSAGFKALGATIDRTHQDGKYPSDHFPVTARLTLRDQSKE